MSHRDRLLLQSLSLLSQELPKLEEPYGTLFKITSCLNAEERQMIGALFATAELIKDEDKELSQYLKEQIIPFIEILGIANWPRTELTDLGTRVGEKHKKRLRQPDMPEEKTAGEEPWKKISEDDLIDAKPDS